MAMVLGIVVSAYRDFQQKHVDPRSKDWFLCGSPLPVIALLTAYLLFTQKFGPKWMKYRQPLNLDRVIQVYNVVQVVLCTWLGLKGLSFYYPFGEYSWACQPIAQDNSPETMEVILGCWQYHMIKVLDLLDTVFFVLRKKDSQLTFLHLYHHTMVVVMSYMGATYHPGGHGVVFGFLNCFVHSIMYSYYFLTNYSSEYKKNIWWKKYVTQIQMVQFLINIVHFGKLLFHPQCDYPRWVVWAFTSQNALMFYLFYRFYKRAYRAVVEPACNNNLAHKKNSN